MSRIFAYIHIYVCMYVHTLAGLCTYICACLVTFISFNQAGSGCIIVERVQEPVASRLIYHSRSVIKDIKTAKTITKQIIKQLNVM